MQTEIEKFDQINQYLKGQLSEQACVQFEAKIGADAELQSEIKMHRLLNETIVDNYLLDVKQKTKHIFQQKKAQQNSKNWTIGLGSIILVGTIFVAYNLFKENTVTEKISLTTEKLQAAKPNEENLNQPTSKNTKTESPKDLNTVKEPIKPNYIPKEPIIEKPIETEIVPEAITKEHSTSVSEIVKTETPTIKSEELNPIKIETTDKIVEKTEKQTETKLREDIQLILNLSRNEPVTFSFEENFNGKIEIFNGNGTEIWQQNIISATPNTWDGTANSGGQVASGQYVFILKSNDGQIVKQGFITVVR